MERSIEDEAQPLAGDGDGGGREAPPWDEPARGCAGGEDAHGDFAWRARAPASGEASAIDGARERHDAFGEARKCAFLEALAKTGCVQEACRRTGVSPRSVYRHQESDPVFADHCRTALRMSATPIELTAWQRAVEGVEQEFACGGEVHVRRRYDGGLLRLLLMGSNPKKYGRNPGFSRKRILKFERKQIEREIRAELERQSNPKGPPERSFEEAIQSVLSKVDAIERHDEPRKLAAGWTKSPDGDWVPPGYGPIPGWVAPPSPETGVDTPRESV